MTTHRVTFRVPDSMLRKMKKLASRDQRNISQWIRLVVEREVKKNGKAAA